MPTLIQAMEGLSATMRLLLIEDDEILGDGLQGVLRRGGHAIDWCQSAEQAVGLLAAVGYELILLDLNLPGMSGVELLQRLRGGNDATPVLVITAREGLQDRVKVLDEGADDYLVKPFEMEELLARVRALHRRNRGKQQSLLAWGEVSLDPAALQVRRNGELISLSVREFALLQILLENPDRVLTRARLEESLYGWGEEVGSNAVEVHIHHLRRKLGAELVRTVRGVGYILGGAA